MSSRNGSIVARIISILLIFYLFTETLFTMFAGTTINVDASAIKLTPTICPICRTPTKTPMPTATPKPRLSPTPTQITYPTPTPTPTLSPQAMPTATAPAPTPTPTLANTPLPQGPAPSATATVTTPPLANHSGGSDPPNRGNGAASPWTNYLVYVLLFIMLSATVALVIVVRTTHIFGRTR